MIVWDKGLFGSEICLGQRFVWARGLVGLEDCLVERFVLSRGLSSIRVSWFRGFVGY